MKNEQSYYITYLFSPISPTSRVIREKSLQSTVKRLVVNECSLATNPIFGFRHGLLLTGFIFLLLDGISEVSIVSGISELSIFAITQHHILETNFFCVIRERTSVATENCRENLVQMTFILDIKGILGNVFSFGNFLVNLRTLESAINCQ